MTPSELNRYLNQLLDHRLRLSVMLWGPPGVGKSSIVRQVAEQHGLSCIDLRLSQLAPTDLRGLPAPQGDRARWLPPEFLPADGAGVLFLDEINLAPPALQGVAQQLILDRRVGSYALPDSWYVWAAGNRKEDRAAVFDMPAPLANRFIHLEVAPSLEDFRAYALRHAIDDALIAFLAFRPELLHAFQAGQLAWPSPRSWDMANQLRRAGLDIAPAVGVGPAAEFDAFLALIRDTPDIDAILHGKGAADFPAEPSVRYATVTALVARAKDAGQAFHAMSWLVEKARPEWIQLFAADMIPLLRERKQLPRFQKALLSRPEMMDYLKQLVQWMTA